MRPSDAPDLLQRSSIDDQEMQSTVVARNDLMMHDDKTPILCDVEGCNAGPYGRHAELQRHKQQKHMEPRFPCTAIGCGRTGKRAFPRVDKLKDHIVAGHSLDTKFRCPKACSQVLTRDLMVIHAPSDLAWPSVEKIRACPMPKCPFRVNVIGKKVHQMDDLIVHLQQEHDNNNRSKHKTMISKRGYDSATGYITCPICLPLVVHFSKHVDFYQHVFQAHMQSIQPLNDDQMKLLTSHEFFFRRHYNIRHIKLLTRSYRACGVSVRFQLEEWFEDAQVPDEVKNHRLVLLSLWPIFCYFPVWDDVEYCEKNPNGRY